MNVVIDIGNTRVKWAVAQGRELLRPDGAVHAGAASEALRALQTALPERADRVLVANVAGSDLGAAVRAVVERRLGVAPEFVATTARRCGVRCGYADPSRLGVDRWAATIAAYIRAGGAVCVIGAGTAVTLDVVDAEGGHLGGLILTGRHLAAAALLHGTSRIGATAGAETPAKGLDLLARNTDDAVSRGAMLALAAGMDRALAEVSDELGAAAPVLLTGGDAAVLRPWLKTPVQPAPHLVLEGLAAMAEEEGECATCS